VTFQKTAFFLKVSPHHITLPISTGMVIIRCLKLIFDRNRCTSDFVVQSFGMRPPLCSSVSITYICIIVSVYNVCSRFV
jgi:hypothetical protein